MTDYFKTSVEGKVNNLPPFKNEALLPLFEAVTNSIQAIEEKGNLKDGEIYVEIKRDSQLSLKGMEPDNPQIIGFEITDNGIGFNEINYDSFLTSDTIHKLEKGCKGIGRFFWLKAFDRVEVDSVYSNESGRRRRCFTFSKSKVISKFSDDSTDYPQITKVKLIGFKEDYRTQQSAYKTTSKIAQRILEHCFSYYINQTIPKIFVKDGNETIYLDDLFQPIKKSITNEEFCIDSVIFNIYHLKLYSTYNKMHNLVFCANSRVVKSQSMEKALGTTQHFDEDDTRFVYSAYVSSKYLDKHVDSSRIDFRIPEKKQDLLACDFPISMEQIREESFSKSKAFLKDYLEAVNERKREIATEYVSEKNPTLKSVLHYCPEIFDEIEPNTSEEKIDEILYRHKGKAEYQIRKQSDRLLKTQAQSIDEIKEEYDELNKKIESFQKDQLAGYILFRKMIIDLLDKKLELNQDGKYNNEDIVHDIVFPRKVTSDEIDFTDHNMWLIDERLTFHSYAASDCRLCDLTTSDSKERPDIITFSEVDEDRIARAVSIIEFKKPQRTNFDEDPTRQLFKYVRKVIDHKVKMSNGRDLLVNETTRFYCYAICDITPQIEEFAENNNYAKLKGELGYYNYNSKLHVHVEIIAFDKIILDVKKRHKVFFETLGI